MKRALLLSGGMDSTALAYWCRPTHAITIDYGQKPAPGEIRAAAAVCQNLSIEHIVLQTDISVLGSGDLAGTPALENAPAPEWWPYRNQFLLTVAAMKCQQLGLTKLLIGALKTDGFHADGAPEFVRLMNALFQFQEGDLEVIAPAHGLTAAELISHSGVPMDILAWSHSCHTAEYACGFCRGCRKHFETMESVIGVPF